MRKSIISIILLVSISMLFVACGNSGPAKDSTEESFSQSIAEEIIVQMNGINRRAKKRRSKQKNLLRR